MATNSPINPPVRIALIVDFGLWAIALARFCCSEDEGS